MPRLVPLMAAAALAGCSDDLPTAPDDSFVPVSPVTLEVRLPWSEFASNLRVFGGFGRPHELRAPVIANQFEGAMDAHTLIRLEEYPTAVTVVDSLGTSRVDTDLTLLDATLYLVFDTTSNTNGDRTVQLRVARITEGWDTETATWEVARDSGGVRTAWSEPGGGAISPLSPGIWIPAVGDTALVALSAAAVAMLGDTTLPERGLRISLETPGERLEILSAHLLLNVVPSLNQDTLINLAVNPVERTFIYAPAAPSPAATTIRVGGTPAWRSTLDLRLPETISGNAAACAHITCPLRLTPSRINHAGILLTTRTSEDGFAPSRPTLIEARGVIAPEVLPKSPISSAFYLDSLGQAAGTVVPESAFQPGGARSTEVPITPLVRSLLAGVDTSGVLPPGTLALMQLLEPASISYASFVGPGQAGEPILRLLLTVSETVGLP